MVELLKPFQKLLKIDVAFKWGEEQHAVLKESMTYVVLP